MPALLIQIRAKHDQELVAWKGGWQRQLIDEQQCLLHYAMLDFYSAQALVALQQLLPDLAAQAKLEEDYFVINVLSPSGFELWLSSAENELTVGFAEHHCHFGWHEGDPQEDAEAAAVYVQRLRAGQLEIAAWYEGEHFVSSITREVGHIYSLTWFQRWWRRKQHLVLRRWVA